MVRFTFGLALLSSCAVRASDLPTPPALIEARLTSQAFLPAQGGTDPGALAFLLIAPRSVADEFGAAAASCGFVTRPATDSDFRESWPILAARQERDEQGRVQVAWDLRAGAHPAFVNLWVELEIQRSAGRWFGPAALAYLSTAW